MDSLVPLATTDMAEGGVEAVDRALAILASFGPGQERQTLAQLAGRTGFYKSTILRLARSLEHGGYLHRDADGRFSIGAEPLRLSAIYRRSLNLEGHVRPVLRELLDETGESASFYRREGDRRLCLYREETRRAVRDHVVEGDLGPIDKGAAGRVLSRFGDPDLDPAERKRLCAQLPMTSFGENDPEMASIAMPVFAHDGLAGALAVSGPISRLTAERMNAIAPTLHAQARRLAARLGAVPPPGMLDRLSENWRASAA